MNLTHTFVYTTAAAGASAAISFDNNLYVLDKKGGSELGFLKVIGSDACGPDSFTIEAHTDASGKNQDECYGLDILKGGVYIDASYSDDNGLTTSNA